MPKYTKSTQYKLTMDSCILYKLNIRLYIDLSAWPYWQLYIDMIAGRINTYVKVLRTNWFFPIKRWRNLFARSSVEINWLVSSLLYQSRMKMIWQFVNICNDINRKPSCNISEGDWLKDKNRLWYEIISL